MTKKHLQAGNQNNQLKPSKELMRAAETGDNSL